MNRFWALVHEENGAFGVSFPDVPGCVSAGATLQDALRSGSEALSAHLAWMEADGDPAPVARSFDELLRDPSLAEDAADEGWHLVEARDVRAPRRPVGREAPPRQRPRPQSGPKRAASDGGR